MLAQRIDIYAIRHESERNLSIGAALLLRRIFCICSRLDDTLFQVLLRLLLGKQPQSDYGRIVAVAHSPIMVARIVVRNRA